MALRLRPAWIVFMVILLVTLTGILFHHGPSYKVWMSATNAAMNSAYVKDKDKDNEEVHYGIIVDAGSSGSRIFVYTWPTHNGDSRQLLNVRPLRDSYKRTVMKKKTPGLSSLASNPTHVQSYIDPLLRFAAQYVPVNKHVETPLYIMATAGMRMIPKAAQTRILEELRSHIRTNYHFLFNDHHVDIITGKQEGVFAWISTNYLLNRFSHNHSDSVGVVAVPSMSHGHMHFRKRTVGVIDMGGGSMQIAFEVPASYMSSIPNSLVAQFNLGCRKDDSEHTYRIYVSTFLGFGVNAARKRWVSQLLTSSAVKYQATSLKPTITTFNSSSNANASSNANEAVPSKGQASMASRMMFVMDPCLPVGLVVRVRYATRTLLGSGKLKTCVESLRDALLGLAELCKNPPCSMAGVHQPLIDFLSTEFFGFSEFWYSSHDILNMGGRYDYRKYFSASQRFCSTSWPEIMRRYRNGMYPSYVTMERLKLQCFKSAWLMTVLHYGLHFPTYYRKFNSVIQIDGVDAQWTLGALLYRTRYIPLRDIQRKELLLLQRHRNRQLSRHYQYWLLAVAAICAVLVLLYLHRTMHNTPMWK